MSYKIELLFLNTPLLLLLILLMILLMFCFMQHYVYKFQPIMYDDSVSYSDSDSETYSDLNLKYKNNAYITNKINKIIELKDNEIKKNINLLSKTIKETKSQLQENFADIQPFDDIETTNLQSNLDIFTDFENTDMSNIQQTMALIKSQRIANKAKIVDLLTNIYVLANIDNINKSNAASYKEYLKFSDPKYNKYYNQYKS